MEAKELKLKTRTELEAQARELRAKIRDVRFALQTGQSKAVRKLRDDKRDLSRVMAALANTTN